MRRVDSTGIRYYYEDCYIGKMGTNHRYNTPDVRGIEMSLDTAGDYII
ncbi:hypothetical protein ACNF5J_04535 [Fannyhessea vaginae]|nr:hypothetical protein [Fannyhessea vaginae]